MPALVSAPVTAWVSAGCGTSAPPAASPAVAAASPAPAAAAAAALLLRLAPAALGRTLAAAADPRALPRWRRRRPRARTAGLLEADAGTTRLAALAGGQVLARCTAGTRLQVSRSPWAPAELMPERILSDLQLALWPSAAVAAAALPPGWTLAEGPGWRELQGAEAVVAIGYPGDGQSRRPAHCAGPPARWLHAGDPQRLRRRPAMESAMTVFLNQMGVACALGIGAEAVRAALWRSDGPAGGELTALHGRVPAPGHGALATPMPPPRCRRTRRWRSARATTPCCWPRWNRSAPLSTRRWRGTVRHAWRWCAGHQYLRHRRRRARGGGARGVRHVAGGLCVRAAGTGLARALSRPPHRRARAGLCAVDRLLLQRQGDGRRRALACGAADAVLCGGVWIPCAASPSPASARWSRSARSAACRCRPTAPASTSGRRGAVPDDARSGPGAARGLGRKRRCLPYLGTRAGRAGRARRWRRRWPAASTRARSTTSTCTAPPRHRTMPWNCLRWQRCWATSRSARPSR